MTIKDFPQAFMPLCYPGIQLMHEALIYLFSACDHDSAKLVD